MYDVLWYVFFFKQKTADEMRISDWSSDVCFSDLFADALRPDVAEAIAALEGAGVAPTILSGDRAAAVAPVARVLGLTAQTGMSPQDKLAAIARQAAAGHQVLKIGAGPNDGPAPAAGYASSAPGSSSGGGKNAPRPI